MGIGFGEIVVVLLIVVLLFGARKIPELGKGLGTGIRSFKEGLSGKAEDDKAVDKSDAEEQDPKLLK